MKRKFATILTLAAFAVVAVSTWRVSSVKAHAAGFVDKTKIAYSCVTAYPEADFNICVMKRDGTDVVRFTTDLTLDAEYPRLSADASKILFRRRIEIGQGDHRHTLGIVNSDGTGALTLFDGEQYDTNDHSVISAGFSPDSSKIAFITYPRNGSTLDRVLWTINSDGTGLTNILTGVLEVDDVGHEPQYHGLSYISFSPDGSKMAIGLKRPGTDNDLGVFTVNVDGSGLTALTETNNNKDEGEPVFSPDGSKIAFISDREPGLNIELAHGQLSIMDVDGANKTVLSDEEGNFQPSFSPDSSKIVFVSMRNGGLFNPEIYVIDADGTNETRLTNDNNLGYNFDPSFSPDGNQIVHAASSNGLQNFEIVVMNTDGSGQTTITSGPGDLFNLSPTYANPDIDGDDVNDPIDNCRTVPNPDQTDTDSDGMGNACDADDDNDGVNDGADNCPLTANQYRIAFSSSRSGSNNYEIYSQNEDGTGVTRLTTTANSVTDDEPSFSSDGSRILFTSNRNNNRDEIFVMNANGTGVTRLTNIAGSNNTAVFNPDGTKIAFVSRRFDNNQNLFIMNSDGSNQIQLTFFTTTGTFATHPSFNHDGTRIAFESQRGSIGNAQWDIFAINPDGTGEVRLTTAEGQDQDPSFSPDGSEIAFTATHNLNFNDVYIMNADGTNQTRLTNTPHFKFHPVFSPDGSQIVFSNGTDNKLYVMNVDGTGVTPLTSGSGVDLYPSFAPQPDSDGDGVGDACDNCSASNPDQADTDLDGVADACDNCSTVSNPDQANNDGDALGDACDPDDDNDGVPDTNDNCPFTANADQADNDGDQIGDTCDPDDDNDGVLDGQDNCNLVPNPDQADNDGDDLGDVCDADDDNDGVLDGIDNCPLLENPYQDDNDLDGIGDECDADDDNDGVDDELDNCASVENPDQADADGDGIGDTCDGSFDVALSLGTNVVVEAPDAAVTFASVTEEGTTSFVGITPDPGDMPSGYTLCPSCPAYDISSTGTYTPPITVCIGVPAAIDQPTFLLMRLLHGEGGVFVDRTTDHVTNMDGTRAVCGVVNSLSPFALASVQAPTAATVSVGGRVSTATGQGIRNALITLTSMNGTERTVRTGSFGYYRFDEVNAGEIYVMSISTKSHTFIPPTIAVWVADELTGVDFVAEPLQ